MTSLSQQRLFTRDYLLGFVVLIGSYIVFIALMTFMALYAAQRFSTNDTAAGFAASSFVVGAGLVRLVIGKYLDFIGRKRTLVLALTVFVLCSVLYPFANHFVLLIVIRVVQGTAFGVISTSVTSAVLDIIPPSRRSEGLGFFSLAATLGTAIGPFAAVRLTQVASDESVFIFTAICAAVSLLAVLPMRIEEHPPSDEEYAERWRIRGSDLLDAKALPVAVVAFISAIGYSLIMTFLSPYLVGRGQAEAASSFFMVFALAMLAVRLFAGRVQDRYGENAVIPAGLVSMALSLLTIGLADSLWLIVLAAVLGGIGQGVAVPGLQAVGINRTSPNRIPIATSTHYLALDTGIAIGPVALGFMIPLAGYSGLYFAGTAIVILAALVYWFSHGRHAKHPKTLNS